MADQVLSDVDNQVHCGGSSETEDREAEEIVYPSNVVTSAGNTDGKVRPANSGVANENVFGVAEVPIGGDPDTGIAVGKYVPVLKKGSGAVVWVKLMAAAGPIPVEEGDVLMLATEDGKVSKADESSVAVKEGFKVGICQMYSPGSATDDLMVRCKI